jgi:pimeloyl-ACP methyl ester carboxylesterase
LRFPKAGHIVMYDQAQEFNKAVLDFLQGKST